MLLTKTIKTKTSVNCSQECIDFSLDFFGTIEYVFSTKKDSRLILNKGKSIYDVLHPVDHSKVEYCLSSLRKGETSKPFEVKIKNIEETLSYPVMTEVTRSGSNFNLKMKRREIEQKNRYDSSLFIHLDEQELLDEVSEKQAYIDCFDKGKQLNNHYVDISQLLLPVILSESCRENYIVAKKFPHVLLEKEITSQLLQDLFTWFFGKLSWFTGAKEYLIEGTIEESNFVLSLKYTGSSFMMHDAIQEHPELTEVYRRLLKNIEKLQGALLSVSTVGGNVKISLPIKYNMLF